MSIRDRLVDARILWSQGRYDGAFLAVVVTVAATSKKRYPNEGDKKAFTQFVSDEMVTLTREINWMPSLMWTIQYNGKPVPFEIFLYKYLRCQIAHEAEIPSDVQFVEKLPIPAVMLPTPTSLLIHRALIAALSTIVLYAKENDGIFPDPAADQIEFVI